MLSAGAWVQPATLSPPLPLSRTPVFLQLWGHHTLLGTYCPPCELLSLIPIAIGSALSTQTLNVEATGDCPWVHFMPHVTLSHYSLSRCHLHMDDLQVHVANIRSLQPKDWYIQATSSTLKYSILILPPKFPQPPVFCMLRPSTVNIEARSLNVELSILLYLLNSHCTSHHSRKISRDFGVSLSISTYSIFSYIVDRVIIWNKIWLCHYTA